MVPSGRPRLVENKEQDIILACAIHGSGRMSPPRGREQLLAT
jgi:hypothetical protein